MSEKKGTVLGVIIVAVFIARLVGCLYEGSSSAENPKTSKAACRKLAMRVAVATAKEARGNPLYGDVANDPRFQLEFVDSFCRCYVNTKAEASDCVPEAVVEAVTLAGW
jgi:hypothetical protein